jgi:hypothetical protein
MNDIIIGFSTSSSIVSRVIRWFTRSKISHAWVSFYSEELGFRLIMHATFGGYKLERWVKWKKENKIISKFSCSTDLSYGVRKMAEQLGKDYDWKSAAMLACRRWIRKFYNPVQDPDMLQCSEAITKLLHYHSFALGLDPESTTPKDLAIFCAENKSFHIKK